MESDGNGSESEDMKNCRIQSSSSSEDSNQEIIVSNSGQTQTMLDDIADQKIPEEDEAAEEELEKLG